MLRAHEDADGNTYYDACLGRLQGYLHTGPSISDGAEAALGWLQEPDLLRWHLRWNKRSERFFALYPPDLRRKHFITRGYLSARLMLPGLGQFDLEVFPRRPKSV